MTLKSVFRLPFMPVLIAFLALAGSAHSSSQETAKPPAPEQSGRVSPATCRKCPNPDFPAEARNAKISSARVIVDAIVTEKGDVDPTSIRVLKDPGNGFADEAIKAVKKWKLKPATKDGKPISTRIPIEVLFRSSD